MITAVKISTETFHTMDEYEQDVQLDDHLEQDVWEGEDEVTGDDVPSDLWSSCDPDQHPEEPAEWIDRFADYVELKRLCAMDDLSENISIVVADASQLTTKFVYDWRLKDFKDQYGAISKRWLRRSRFVAREFAFLEKRSDTYAPATSTHILNLLPVLYLQKLSDLSALEDNTQKSKVILGTIDVKDALLMVEQPSPMVVTLLGKKYWVRKNLPGQRLGAKNWYWHLRHFLSQSMDFRFCIEQPCIAKNDHCAKRIKETGQICFSW
jgi:hypothetical protein